MKNEYKIVGEWIKFYEYEIKLGQHTIWISKSFELDNEGVSGINKFGIKSGSKKFNIKYWN